MSISFRSRIYNVFLLLFYWNVCFLEHSKDLGIIRGSNIRKCSVCCVVSFIMEIMANSLQKLFYNYFETWLCILPAKEMARNSIFYLFMNSPLHWGIILRMRFCFASREKFEIFKNYSHAIYSFTLGYFLVTLKARVL